MSKVSVLIPAYNAAKYIVETIESALTQGEDVEVIVIDDNSTDETYSIVKTRFPSVKLISAFGKGAQAARNQALREATSGYIKFLDADDILLPGSIKHQTQILDSLPSGYITYGPAVSMSEDGILGYPIHHSKRPESMNTVAHILYHSPLTSCPLHRRKDLINVGGMDETLPREHENDLHLRLVLNGVRFVFDKRPVYGYRQHVSHFSLMKGGFARFGENWMLNYLIKQELLINAHYSNEVPSEIVEHLALLYWKGGRSVLREGFSTSAQEYFSQARRLAPDSCVCGTKIYSAFVKICGPFLAESIVAHARVFVATLTGLIPKSKSSKS